MIDDFLSLQLTEVYFSFNCRHSTPLLMIYLLLSSLCQHLIGWRALEMMLCSWSIFTKDGMSFFNIHQSFCNTVGGCVLIAIKNYKIVWGSVQAEFCTTVIYSMVWKMVVVYTPSEGNGEQGILKRRSQYK